MAPVFDTQNQLLNESACGTFLPQWRGRQKGNLGALRNYFDCSTQTERFRRATNKYFWRAKDCQVRAGQRRPFIIHRSEPEHCASTGGAQRYLLSRLKAAELLNLPALVRWYGAGFYALKLWRIEQQLNRKK